MQKLRSDKMPYRLKEFHNDRHPQGYCAHRDIYRDIKKECHEIGNLHFDHGAVLFIGCSMRKRKQCSA